ncbi:hypothetical protein NAEGRDRAFT_71242 [Naegleria gruberi]|uniref:F-box domain-containing protein n=1 Tax=Naegleria gruberi TaxID=5762 RepID=D2VQJ0_NAEGR|nr:uncharacterized protein NAEGRDRAFT_71242 [Naegleria gruberi]EFC40879.1 hypothetical protein NAEGRDRAFT_71242 [Naegleria gruberi]|eukprot:XP_002673623.1 hypothetical protein NAEGRDRAFT_71242 [Naegleria gruberi strain NEG-M]
MGQKSTSQRGQISQLYKKGQPTKISDISNDVLYGVIFSFLDFRELIGTFRLVCKQWNKWNEEIITVSNYEIRFVGRKERIKSFELCLVNGHLNNLRKLTLTHLQDSSILEEISHLQSKSLLTFLDLQNNVIGGASGATLISNSVWLSNLEELTMNGCKIGDLGMIEIVKSENMKNLTSLNVRENIIGNNGFVSLLTSNNLSKLTMLNLGKNIIDGKSLLSFTIPNTNVLNNLKVLILDENNLFNDFAKILLTKCQFTQLEVLDLSQTQISNDCIEKGLCISPHFNTLTQLNLNSNLLSEPAVRSLIYCKYLNNLEMLHCMNLKSIDRKLKEQLLERFTLVDVSLKDGEAVSSLLGTGTIE